MNKKENNLDTIISKITLGITIAIAFCLVIFGIVSFIFLSPVDINSETVESFVVESGWSKHKVAEELEKAKLIKNAFFFKFYMKINEKEIYAGTYRLSKSMNVDEIIKVLNSADSLENETITVTFIEGKRLTDYVKKISETFDIAEEEINTKLSDEKYLKSLINQYWFLTEDILNSDIYYPLEGYLFPDTYIIKKSATIEEIIGKMLSTMGDKLSIYKEEINVSDYTIHELLTLASIIELEGVSVEDRAGVAGVFYNRLRDHWTLGSDVTTYYSVKKNITDKLYQKDIDSCNPYNTRSSCVDGLPIGPIDSPSLASITAAIEPSQHNYYYFVADIHNKTYFNSTESGHIAEVNRLKNEGLWPE